MPSKYDFPSTLLRSQRAGMPEKGMKIPFSCRLKSRGRPSAPALHFRERTAADFTVVWTAPITPAGKPDTVTHYELQLATAAPNGTYYAWQELWCGAGHELELDPRIAAAQKMGDSVMTNRLQDELEEERQVLITERQQALSESTKGSRSSTPSIITEIDNTGGPIPVYSYTLPCDPHLFGQLRIRCWAAGEERPSKFSRPVSLQRVKGKAEVDIKLQMVMNIRSEYFTSLSQHVTCGKALPYRIGNPPSLNKWGGDSIPPPPVPTAKERAMGNVMAPVPYDVPRLKNDECSHAGDELARAYRELGVVGGGGGQCFGLRIDHILHGIAGTPTEDGLSSPRRTVASMNEPLMALLELAYADALLPLIDATPVLRSEWQAVDEKVYGVVARISSHRAHYKVCEPHVKEILVIMLEIYETARQCQPEQHLHFHLTHIDYSKTVKQQLKAELSEKLKGASWRLSTELLKMQLAVRKAAPTEEATYGLVDDSETNGPVELAGVLKEGSSQVYVPLQLATMKRVSTKVSAVTKALATKASANMLTPSDEDRPSLKLAKTAAAVAPSLSLLKGIHEQSVAAQERARARMEETIVAFVRARRAGRRLFRVIDDRLQAKREAELIASSKTAEENGARRKAEISAQADIQASSEAARAAEARQDLRRKLLAASSTALSGRGLQSDMLEHKVAAFWEAPYEMTPYRQKVLEMTKQPNQVAWEALRKTVDEDGRLHSQAGQRRGGSRPEESIHGFLAARKSDVDRREVQRSMLPSRTTVWEPVAGSLRAQTARTWRPAPRLVNGAHSAQRRRAPLDVPRSARQARHELFVPSPWKRTRHRTLPPSRNAVLIASTRASFAPSPPVPAPPAPSPPSRRLPSPPPPSPTASTLNFHLPSEFGSNTKRPVAVRPSNDVYSWSHMEYTWLLRDS